VLVLDHHLGNQRDLEGEEGCFFDMKKSGCMLAWEYYFPDLVIPALLVHVGNRDLGDWSNADTRSLGHALMNLPTPLSVDQVYDIIRKPPSAQEEILQEWISRGRELEAKLEECKSRLLPERRTIVYRGLPYVAYYVLVQGHQFVNELAEHVYTKMCPDADLVILYSPTGESATRWKLYFRTNKDHVDVSLLAKEVGGNGHAKAAGAVVDKLPWY
jgi:hypothetical protein